ncbi:Hint domain-containing protein [Paracoccus luteus]|uniref:Hint domain-containing protein n=1 Tax=Paracoccus luteus TaxID=2508543 RepID=UPI003CCC5B2C
MHCLAAGTRIENADGLRLAEQPEPGDPVRTNGHRMQPIRWIGSERPRRDAGRQSRPAADPHQGGRVGPAAGRGVNRPAARGRAQRRV